MCFPFIKLPACHLKCSSKTLVFLDVQLIFNQQNYALRGVKTKAISLEPSNSWQCLWVQSDHQISCKISSHTGEDTHILCLTLEEKMYFLLPQEAWLVCDCVLWWDHFGGAEDKMSLRIMWLPLRYEEVNYIPWFIIWKLKTHSFSNLIPPSMEQCSLWAKLANNVTNSDADVISIRGAAACGDERVPDGSLPLLSPRLDNSPAVVIITWAIKEG